MGERKPQNKYYPPDFDPCKIPRPKQPKNRQIKVRAMLPMSVRCGTCGTYISRGTKFNSREEVCAGETYLGIKILRFYFRCTRCSAEITFKTDPKNSDYTVEFGATRNFEPWREEEEAVGKEKRRREAEEMGDAMRVLENRAEDSKRDMDRLANLEEMMSMKARQEGVPLLEIHLKHSAHLKEEKTVAAELDGEDEERIKCFRESRDYVKRIDEDDDDDFCVPSPSSVTAKISGSCESVLNPTDVLTKINNGNKSVVSKMPKFIVKPKPAAANPQKRQKTEPAAVQDNGGKAPVAEEKRGASEQEKTSVFQSLCQYDSDDDSDE